MCNKYNDDIATHWARLGAYNDGSGESPTIFNYEASAFVSEVGDVGFDGDTKKQHGCNSYADYQLREWSTTSTYCYPIGGMRSFVLSMRDEIRSRGGKVYTGERIIKINKSTDKRYKFIVETTKRIVRVKTFLHLGLPPYYLQTHSDLYDNSDKWVNVLLNPAPLVLWVSIFFHFTKKIKI